MAIEKANYNSLASSMLLHDALHWACECCYDNAIHAFESLDLMFWAKFMLAAHTVCGNAMLVIPEFLNNCIAYRV